jgi:hypothetical protein
MPTASDARSVRSGAFAVSAVSLSLGAHVTAGGDVPVVPLLLLLVALVDAASSTFARRPRGPIATAVALLAAQVVLHGAFMFAAPAHAAHVGRHGARRRHGAGRHGRRPVGQDRRVGDDRRVRHAQHDRVRPGDRRVRLDLALDLRPGSGLADVRRLMRLLSDDAARLMSARPPLGAEDPELPALPSRLTVTFGFGPGLFEAIGHAADCPEVVRNLPTFPTDRLEPQWSGGDLLLQVCSDDPVPLSYAVRRLVRDARSVTSVRWTQRGFNPARGSEPAGTTPRNLFGQRDGTANPAPGSPELTETVWVRDGPAWLVGGSMLVLRRIRMDLEKWGSCPGNGNECWVSSIPGPSL